MLKGLFLLYCGRSRGPKCAKGILSSALQAVWLFFQNDTLEVVSCRRFLDVWYSYQRRLRLLHQLLFSTCLPTKTVCHMREFLRSRQKKLSIAAEDWTALEEVADMKAPLFVHGPEPINLHEEMILVPGDQHAGVPRSI